ncbi:MAG TPA: matrixin family metalloprotease [Planctomycetes bacterium]|nr:matrixin family metalloprotease [Planctomycetota bacterium]
MRISMKRFLVAGAVLGLAVLAQKQAPEEANAFALTGDSWASSTVTYYVNPSFVDAPAGSAQDQIAALQRGASEWKSAGQIPFQFLYGGTTTVNTVAPNDGTNAVFYSHIDGGGALATTTWSSFSNGNMVGFDIQFYDRTGSFDFIWATNPNFSQFDIESVAVHEFGHALGMAHSDVVGATMYPSVSAGNIQNRTLEADDIAGVQSIYGTQATGVPSVTQVNPPFAQISSGTRITLTGTNLAGGDPQTVTFGGIAATDVTVLDDGRIECNLPVGVATGYVDVSVSHAQGSFDLTNGFFNTAISEVAPLSISAPAQFQMEFPADGNLSYQVFVAYGFQAGLSLATYGDPTDNRVIPINDDPLLRAVLDNQFPQNFSGLTGTLDPQGMADFFVYIPNIPSYVGGWLCFTAVTLNAASPSGVKNIAEADVYVIQN